MTPLRLVHNEAWNTAAWTPLPSKVPSSVSATSTVELPVTEWWQAALTRLEELLHLPEGWDGYVGKPVTFANVVFTLRMLEQICLSHTASPSIVPGVDGDLQVEWHTHSGDIELHVAAPNKVHGWCSLPNGEEKELDLRNDFSEVAAWVRKIVEQPVATVAAAA